MPEGKTYRSSWISTRDIRQLCRHNIYLRGYTDRCRIRIYRRSRRRWRLDGQIGIAVGIVGKERYLVSCQWPIIFRIGVWQCRYIIKIVSAPVRGIGARRWICRRRNAKTFVKRCQHRLCASCPVVVEDIEFQIAFATFMILFQVLCTCCQYRYYAY